MGKKVKKKAARNAQKEKGFPGSSHNHVSHDIIPSTVIDGVSGVKEARICPHLEKGINVETISSKLTSLESLKCHDCREGVADRRSSKGKGKHGKKGGGSKSESKAVWVCLECGHFSCGGVGFPTTPQTHAARHAKQNRHPLVVQFANPNLRWCFLCHTLIPVQTSEEKGELKDALTDIVKLLKVCSSSETSVDVENVWFGSGSGSVTSEIKPVNTSSSSENSGGYMVRGLVNLGNTCFFNSVLQNLLQMDKLRDYFLRLEGPGGPLTVSLKKLFVETNLSTGVRNVINPRSFFGCVCAKAPQFRGYQQHDSHEFLRCLLDGLCTEESSLRKRVLSSEKDSTVPERTPTFVDTIFGGQISSTVSCLECGHASVVYEPYLDLSLPLPTKSSPSKRTTSVSRSKQPKLPPKKRGKFRTKTNRASNSLPSNGIPNIATSGKSCALTPSIEAHTEKKVAPSGDSTQPESVVLGGMCDKKDQAVQELVDTEVNVIEHSENTIKVSVISSDDLAHLDYVEPATMLHSIDKAAGVSSDFSSCLDYVQPNMVSKDNDAATCISDASVTKNNGKKELVQNEELLQCTLEASKQVDFLGFKEILPLTDDSSWLDYLEPSIPSNDHGMPSHIENPLVVQKSGRSNNDNFEENDPLFEVQEVENMLLPCKEVTSSSSGNDVRLSSGSCEQEPSDFDGFGGLFDEPDVAAGPTLKSNGVAESGFMATYNSESDPDEVDNTDSSVSVEKCLAYFTSPELLTKAEHAWHCEQCSNALLEQRMRVKNKMHKPVSNGGEKRVVTVPSDSYTECSPPNGVRDTNDGSIGRDVASESEEEGTVVNSVIKEPSHDPSSVTTSTEESCTDQDPRYCGVNEPSEKKIVSKSKPNENGMNDEGVESKSIKVARDASKRILINKAPPILTIHLKRFSQDARGRLSKLNGHVDFSDTIDLKPYIDPSCCSDRGTYRYQLTGVVEHLGTMRGGHYVAYVRGSAKGNMVAPETQGFLWYHASDAYVREVSFDEVLRCEAYILFYQEM